MKLLALETSSDACSVALQCDKQLLIDHQLAPQQHARLLLPMVDQLLAKAGIKPADLDGVALGCGPGSFTGVRIAAAAAQGIALGADIGVVRVSSLAALAQSVVREHKATQVLAVLDARMGEVYCGAYVVSDNADAPLSNISEDRVCAPNDVALPDNTGLSEWVLAGSGADAYPDDMHKLGQVNEKPKHVANCWPNAQDVLSLAMPDALAGRFVSAADAVPVYLRDRVALTTQERERGETL